MRAPLRFSCTLLVGALTFGACTDTPAAPDEQRAPTLSVMSIGVLPTTVTTAGLRYRIIATAESGEVPLTISAGRDTIRGGYPFPAGLLEVQVVARDAASNILLQSFRDTVVVQPDATVSYNAVLLCVSVACEGTSGDGVVSATALVPMPESEPNNFLTNADSLGVRSLSGIGRVSAGAGRLASALDVDVFRMDLPSAASAVSYEVQLYAQRVESGSTLLTTLEQVAWSETNINGTSVQSVTTCAGVTTNDTCLTVVVPASAQATRIYVRVSGRSGTSGRYTLVLRQLGAGGFADAFTGSGALDTKWQYFGSLAAAPLSASRVSDRWQTSTHASGNTQSASTGWFNAARGQAWWQPVTIPASGEIRISAIDLGIGTVANPTGSVPDVNQFSFAALVVQDDPTTAVTYEFLAPGHRGTQVSTLETKTTVAGVSSVSDLGLRVLGTSVTRADVQVRIRADGTLRWFWRAAGSSATWVAINSTGISAGGGHDFGVSGDTIFVGLTAYGFDFINTAFVGTCAAVTYEVA
jgi:hypothetical protein